MPRANTANGFFEKHSPTMGNFDGRVRIYLASVFAIAARLGVGVGSFRRIEKIANDPPSTVRAGASHRSGGVVRDGARRLGRDQHRARLPVRADRDATPDNTFKFNVEYGWGGGGTRLTTGTGENGDDD